MKFYLQKYKLLLASIIAVFSLHNSAESALNLKEVEEKLLSILPTEIELLSIQKTDIEGFYEVNFQGIEPLFVSSDGNYLVSLGKEKCPESNWKFKLNKARDILLG